MSPIPSAAATRLHVVVVGAGAFGGWTALELARRGVRVTLLDPWGPASSRASSGGETRLIRSVYGADRLYAEWSARALATWREWRGPGSAPFYRRSGLLWLVTGDDSYVRDALPLPSGAGALDGPLAPREAARRYPVLSAEGLASVWLEEEAGYLLARQATRAVRDAAIAAGADYRELAVRPGPVAGGRLRHLELSDGSRLSADAYLFACGPWLGTLFPEVIGDALRPSRQEVFFFAGPTPGATAGLPAVIELAERIFYTVPDVDGRGLKVADDERGATFDPEREDRLPTPGALALARAFLAHRFPTLAAAPAVESRVCTYENSPDGHLILGPHPGAANLWIAGGGSGHGFKLGPAVGEHLARLVLGEDEPLPRFAVARLAAAAGFPRSTQFGTAG